MKNIKLLWLIYHHYYQNLKNCVILKLISLCLRRKQFELYIFITIFLVYSISFVGTGGVFTSTSGFDIDRYLFRYSLMWWLVKFSTMGNINKVTASLLILPWKYCYARDTFFVKLNFITLCSSGSVVIYKIKLSSRAGCSSYFNRVVDLEL